MSLLQQLDSTSDHDEALAITGMACVLPQASNLEEYWSNLVAGKDCVTPVPEARWSSKNGPVFEAGFAPNIDLFDAEFFGISKAEASRMDPQQRMVLEQGYLAMHQAGFTKESCKKKDIGVFVGVMTSDITEYYNGVRSMYEVVGSSRFALANRFSYLLGLTGPSLNIDTACSSSLVAFDTACRYLKSKDCSGAVVAGVNAMVARSTFENFTNMGMLAPDGRCKTYDASANGYGRGEGCGAVFVEPYSPDKFAWALYCGSAVNQDGATATFSAPSGPSQERVITKALANADVDADEIGFVECHGTGTPLGDPIEVGSLFNVYGKGRDSSNPVRLSSAKSNIGHTEGAAGVAGLIKLALSLHHAKVPQAVHYASLNPEIQKRIASNPEAIQIVQQTSEWKDEDRYGALSSFGWGGTNAHAILQNAPTHAFPTPTTASVYTPTYFKPVWNQVDPFVGQIYANGTKYRSNPTWSAGTLAYLTNHRVGRVPIMPGSGYIELAAAFAKEVYGSGAFEVSNIDFQNILYLSKDMAPLLQVDYDPADGGLVVSSKEYEDDEFVVNATMEVSKTSDYQPPQECNVGKLKESLTPTKLDVYAKIGNQYMEDFQGVTSEGYVSENLAVVKLEVPPNADSPYLDTSALLDAAGHYGITKLAKCEEPTYLKDAGKYVFPSAECRSVGEAWACLEFKETEDGEIATDVHVFRTDGAWVASILGITAGTMLIELSEIEQKVESVVASLDRTQFLQPDYSQSPFSLKGKTVVLSGGSRGIGAAMAVRMGREGANVCILARTMGDPFTRGTARYAAQEVSNAGGVGYAIETDLADEANVERSIRKIIKRFGSIDVLVNNASALWTFDTLTVDEKRYDTMFQTCIRGMLLSTLKCMPYLLQSENPRILTTCPSGIPDADWLKPHVQYSTCKISMGYLAHLLSKKYPTVQFNTIWPKCTIATRAILASFNDEVLRRSFTVAAMADAACMLVSKPTTTFHHTDVDIVEQQLLKDPDDVDHYLIEPGNRDYIPDFMIDVVQETDVVTTAPKAENPSQRTLLVVGDGPGAKTLAYALQAEHRTFADELPDSCNTVIFYPEQVSYKAFEDIDSTTFDAMYVDMAKKPFLWMQQHVPTFSKKENATLVHVLPKPGDQLPYRIVEHITRMYAVGHAAEFSDLRVVGVVNAQGNPDALTQDVLELLDSDVNGMILDKTNRDMLYRGYDDIQTTDKVVQHTPNVATGLTSSQWVGIPMVDTECTFTDENTVSVDGNEIELVRNATIDQALTRCQQGKACWFVFDYEQGRVNGLVRTYLAENPTASVKVVEGTLTEASAATIYASAGIEFRVSGGVVLERKLKPIVSLPSATPQLDAEYLVTGGLGALGRLSANRLHELGASKILLASSRRTEVPDDWEYDWTPVVVKCDVSDEKAVQQLFVNHPNIRGIVHSAGILHDAMLDAQTPELMNKVAKPKSIAARLLDRYSSNLDFFVVYSSVSSCFGSPGQANYSSANADLDRLAEQRQARGQPATSLQWGAWNTGGMALEQTLRRVRESGLGVVEVDWGMEVLTQALANVLPAVTLASPVDWSVYMNQREDDPSWLSNYDHYRKQADDEHNMASVLEGLSVQEKHAVIKREIQDLLSSILGEGIEDEEASLMDAGLDSLSSVEFRNGLQKKFGLTLSSTLMFDYPNIKGLTTFLASHFVTEDPFTSDEEYSFTYDKTSSLDKCRELTVYRKNVGWIKFLGDVDATSLDINACLTIDPKKVTAKGVLKGKPVIMYFHQFVPKERLNSAIWTTMSNILQKRNNILLSLDQETGDIEWFQAKV